MNPSVDFYFSKSKRWREELLHLRMILLDCGLSEELKWGVPCYTRQSRNIALIHEFKEYCAVLFPKGVLLKDSHGILIQQTSNSQSARQIRFTGTEQVLKLEPVLKAYVQEAIAVEEAGLKVAFQKPEELVLPEEFQELLAESVAVKNAFKALTPGRQRAYILYFSSPKQSKTRKARVEKCTPKILSGLGLDD